ncbi:MAG: hypothetical protein R3D61_15310 [Defluviimonas denitrificans]
MSSRKLGLTALVVFGSLMAVTFLAWDGIAARINDRALDRFEASDIPTARLYWATLALTGDATAENNLGVLAQRGYDMPPDPDLARAHFTTAADKGSAIAAYNLARMGKDLYDTDPEEVRRNVALLKPLADAGEPHAAAEMVRRLYFLNRAEILGLGEGLSDLRVSYARQAAESGDPVYLYLLGQMLEKHYGETANLDDLGEAVEALLAAQKLGELRAASELAGISRQIFPDDRAALPAALGERDSFGWRKIAAEGGLVSAKCAIAVDRLREISMQETLSPPAQAPGPVDAETEEALGYAEDCATATRETYRVENRPFGRPALYAGRPTGSYPALVDSPAYAAKILGIVYAEGRLRPRDPDLARHWFQRPFKEGFPYIEDMLNAL